MKIIFYISIYDKQENKFIGYETKPKITKIFEPYKGFKLEIYDVYGHITTTHIFPDERFIIHEIKTAIDGKYVE